jgi:hypothetical protein
LLLFVGRSAQGLDFTPQFTEINADGIPTKAMYFADGEKRVFITPPAGWTCTGGAASALLRNEATARATVVLTLSSVPIFPTDAAKQKAAAEAVLALAPKGAERVALEGETPNPIAINGWTSHQLRIGYDVLETRMQKSVTLIKLNNREELQVIVTAPEKDFRLASSAATWCLNSWHKK